jgi:hypothetical protein
VFLGRNTAQKQKREAQQAVLRVRPPLSPLQWPKGWDNKNAQRRTQEDGKRKMKNKCQFQLNKKILVQLGILESGKF